MTAMMLGSKAEARRGRRTSPERKLTAGYALVERGGDIEAVVEIMFVVANEPCDLVPDRPPRRTGKAEPSGKAGRIAEREIETHENLGIARHRRRQPFCQEGLCCVPGGRVDESLARGIDPADPDAIAADPRHVRRTPIDHHKRVEHQRWRGPAGSLSQTSRTRAWKAPSTSGWSRR